MRDGHLQQGHVLFTRHAGSSIPCPQVDFAEGFNAFMAFAYGVTVPASSTAVAAITQAYGEAFSKLLVFASNMHPPVVQAPSTLGKGFFL